MKRKIFTSNDAKAKILESFEHKGSENQYLDMQENCPEKASPLPSCHKPVFTLSLLIRFSLREWRISENFDRIVQKTRFFINFSFIKINLI